MVETGIALAPDVRLRGPALRSWAAHLFTLAFLAIWEGASLLAPSR